MPTRSCRSETESNVSLRTVTTQNPKRTRAMRGLEDSLSRYFTTKSEKRSVRIPAKFDEMLLIDYTKEESECFGVGNGRRRKSVVCSRSDRPSYRSNSLIDNCFSSTPFTVTTDENPYLINANESDTSHSLLLSHRGRVTRACLLAQDKSNRLSLNSRKRKQKNLPEHGVMATRAKSERRERNDAIECINEEDSVNNLHHSLSPRTRSERTFKIESSIKNEQLDFNDQIPESLMPISQEPPPVRKVGRPRKIGLKPQNKVKETIPFLSTPMPTPMPKPMPTPMIKREPIQDFEGRVSVHGMNCIQSSACEDLLDTKLNILKPRRGRKPGKLQRKISIGASLHNAYTLNNTYDGSMGIAKPRRGRKPWSLHSKHLKPLPEDSEETSIIKEVISDLLRLTVGRYNSHQSYLRRKMRDLGVLNISKGHISPDRVKIVHFQPRRHTMYTGGRYSLSSKIRRPYRSLDNSQAVPRIKRPYRRRILNAQSDPARIRRKYVRRVPILTNYTRPRRINANNFLFTARSRSPSINSNTSDISRQLVRKRRRKHSNISSAAFFSGSQTFDSKEGILGNAEYNHLRRSGWSDSGSSSIYTKKSNKSLKRYRRSRKFDDSFRDGFSTTDYDHFDHATHALNRMNNAIYRQVACLGVELEDVEVFNQAVDLASSECLQLNPHQHSDRIGLPSVIIGGVQIKAWCRAPYPAEYAAQEKLYICEFCLAYLKSKRTLLRHVYKCNIYGPPGKKIYTNDQHTVFEVNGGEHTVYCQNLCLLAKLFLDHKTLHSDVEPFLFYVLTREDNKGYHLIGYFSKEKVCVKNYNLSCIMVLPNNQKLGYGSFLIDFSYLLSRKQDFIGTPERPLSELGKISYQSYWKKIALRILAQTEMEFNFSEISKATGILPSDIFESLRIAEVVVLQDDKIMLVRDLGKLQPYVGDLNPHLQMPSETEQFLEWDPPQFNQEIKPNPDSEDNGTSRNQRKLSHAQSIAPGTSNHMRISMNRQRCMDLSDADSIDREPITMVMQQTYKLGIHYSDRIRRKYARLLILRMMRNNGGSMCTPRLLKVLSTKLGLQFHFAVNKNEITIKSENETKYSIENTPTTRSIEVVEDGNEHLQNDYSSRDELMMSMESNQCLASSTQYFGCLNDSLVYMNDQMLPPLLKRRSSQHHNSSGNTMSSSTLSSFATSPPFVYSPPLRVSPPYNCQHAKDILSETDDCIKSILRAMSPTDLTMSYVPQDSLHIGENIQETFDASNVLDSDSKTAELDDISFESQCEVSDICISTQRPDFVESCESKDLTKLLSSLDEIVNARSVPLLSQCADKNGECRVKTIPCEDTTRPQSLTTDYLEFGNFQSQPQRQRCLSGQPTINSGRSSSEYRNSINSMQSPNHVHYNDPNLTRRPGTAPPFHYLYSSDIVDVNAYNRMMSQNSLMLPRSNQDIHSTLDYPKNFGVLDPLSPPDSIYNQRPKSCFQARMVCSPLQPLPPITPPSPYAPRSNQNPQCMNFGNRPNYECVDNNSNILSLNDSRTDLNPNFQVGYRPIQMRPLYSEYGMCNNNYYSPHQLIQNCPMQVQTFRHSMVNNRHNVLGDAYWPQPQMIFQRPSWDMMLKSNENMFASNMCRFDSRNMLADMCDPSRLIDSQQTSNVRQSMNNRNSAIEDMWNRQCQADRGFASPTAPSLYRPSSTGFMDSVNDPNEFNGFRRDAIVNGLPSFIDSSTKSHQGYYNSNHSNVGNYGICPQQPSSTPNTVDFRHHRQVITQQNLNHFANSRAASSDNSSSGLHSIL